MPPVVDMVMSANRGYAGMNTAAFEQKVNRIEKTWNTPEADVRAAVAFVARFAAAA